MEPCKTSLQRIDSLINARNRILSFSQGKKFLLQNSSKCTIKLQFDIVARDRNISSIMLTKSTMYF